MSISELPGTYIVIICASINNSTMNIWCSEVASLIGQNHHITPVRACAIVVKRFLRGQGVWLTPPKPSNPPNHPTRVSEDDISKRRRIGCDKEGHVYRNICLHKDPPETSRFLCDRGIYTMTGQVDGIYDDHSIIEIKTRMANTNRCYHHEYVQMQLYMECLGKRRCLFVQHMLSNDQNYTLWVHRNRYLWNNSIEVRLVDMAVRMHIVVYVHLLQRLESYLHAFKPTDHLHVDDAGQGMVANTAGASRWSV
jgi:hypothetical protein